MRATTRGAALVLSIILPATAGTVADGAAAREARTTRVVVYSDQEYTMLREEPSDAQIRAADHKKLIVDSGTPGALIVSVKMASIPDNAPGDPGFHAHYTVMFTTVNRHGDAPINGRLEANTFYDYLLSRVSTNGGEDCPGTVMIDPESNWVTFAISKHCFPGKARVITRYSLETSSYNFIVRGDGVVDDTDDAAYDRTKPRHPVPLRLR